VIRVLQNTELLQTEEIKQETLTSVRQVFSHVYLSAQVKKELPQVAQIAKLGTFSLFWSNFPFQFVFTEQIW
jgi:hypothetical protein